MSISLETLALAKKYTDEHGGGGGGTTNYNQLTNKPSINGVELVGDKTTAELGIKDGQTPNITIGSVETLPAGSDVTASISGQTPNLVLNLGIPQGQQGDPGQAATVTVGTTTTGAPGSQASVVNSGTKSAAVLDFTIPQGESGAGGGYSWELIKSQTLTEDVDSVSFNFSETPLRKCRVICTPGVQVTGWKSIAINGGQNIATLNNSILESDMIMWTIDWLETIIIHAEIGTTKVANGVNGGYASRAAFKRTTELSGGLDTIQSFSVITSALCVSGAHFEVWGVRA